MTTRNTESRGRCKPVRPLSINMMAAGAGAASEEEGEREEVQDMKRTRMDDDQLLKDQRIDTEDELELFGPSADDGEEPAQDEGQQARRLARPLQPTKEGILQHELTHIPFRSWC